MLTRNFHEDAAHSYAQKISVRRSRDEAERTTLERSRMKRAEEETLKILVIFKNHQRIHEEELQKAETLKISWNSFKFVKDFCRR